MAGFNQFGGRHCETTALRCVLAHLSVKAPHTDQAFTEEMLLGIGGGIGAMYWVFQFGETPFFFAGTRYGEPDTLMIEEIAKRLSIPATLRKTSSAKRGAADLEAVLAAGRPAIVWVDMPALPYLAIPEQAHFGGHGIVVYGIENGEALIADRGVRPVRAKLAELAAARGSKFKPYPPEHKLLDVTPPPEPIGARTLERAVLRGISDTCRHLLWGPIENIGLRALLKWANLVADERNPKGWPRVFARPVDLSAALMSTFMFIEISGTGGCAFRNMYAAFLEEAAAVIRQPELSKLAAGYRNCARLWSEAARAALPDWAPALKETRKLMIEKNRIFEQQPDGAIEKMLAINARHERIVAAPGPSSRGASPRDPRARRSVML